MSDCPAMLRHAAHECALGHREATLDLLRRIHACRSLGDCPDRAVCRDTFHSLILQINLSDLPHILDGTRPAHGAGCAP